MDKKTKMTTVTLSNDFHDTEVRVRVPAWIAGESDEQYQAWMWIQESKDREYYAGPARRRYNRVCNALCGSSDCQCGIVR
jgi:hypothetical protein